PRCCRSALELAHPAFGTRRPTQNLPHRVEQMSLATAAETGEHATAGPDLRPVAGAGSEKFSWRLVLLVFVLTAAGLVAKAIFNTGKIPLLNDTDDAMRMVTVRDLLAGQNWLDHTQYRLNTPFGADIHW